MSTTRYYKYKYKYNNYNYNYRSYAAATKRVVHLGGPVFNKTRPKLWYIFWGSQWNSGSPAKRKNELVSDMQKLINSAYFYSLKQYGGVLSPASVTPVVLTTHPVPSQKQITFPQVTAAIRAAQTSGLVADPDKLPDTFDLDNVYIVWLPPGKIMPTGFGAAHASGASTGGKGYAYAFLPYNEYPGSRFPAKYTPTRTYAGFSAREMTSQALSHELVDLLTDPVVGKGWVDRGAGWEKGAEVAQMTGCGHYVDRVVGVAVESYYSDLDGKCVFPGKDKVATVPVVAPPPTPAPTPSTPGVTGTGTDTTPVASDPISMILNAIFKFISSLFGGK